MKLKANIIFTIFLSLIWIAVPLAQAQNQAIEPTLEVYRITTNDAGEEVAEQVVNIQPGDTLEYRLEYTNVSSGSISNLQPVLPVPAGLQYLTDTADPAISEASLDTTGSTFQTLPIMRQETLESGLVTEREVSADEYRRLRWTVPSLAAQESVMLVARVFVSNQSGR